MYQFTLILTQTPRRESYHPHSVNEEQKGREVKCPRWHSQQWSRFQTNPTACLLTTTLLATTQMIPPLFPTTMLIPSLLVPLSLCHPSSAVRSVNTYWPLYMQALNHLWCLAQRWYFINVIWTTPQFLRSGWNKPLLIVNIFFNTL